MSSNNQIVGPGVSGKAANFDAKNVSHETVVNELALLNLGDCIPLNISVDIHQFMSEIKAFDNDWVDYLPRTDRPNNRYGLVLKNLPGKGHQDNPSRAQANSEAGRIISELDFNSNTIVYEKCPSLHPLLNYFEPLGRTFLVKSNIGGYFVPHRDHPSMPRESFRIAVFLNNCGPLEYDWFMESDTKLQFDLGRAYYINTRKTHRTISWVNDSIHLILNVPLNNENVAKVLASLQHTH